MLFYIPIHTRPIRVSDVHVYLWGEETVVELWPEEGEEIAQFTADVIAAGFEVSLKKGVFRIHLPAGEMFTVYKG